MDHRPEVAIPLTQPLWIVAENAGRDGAGEVSGHVVAIGWDRPQGTTFYLVSDPKLPRPVWIPEEKIISNSSTPPG